MLPPYGGLADTKLRVGGEVVMDMRREPAQAQEDSEDLKERPLADSAEESPYLHPASKSRFGSQHKGIRSDQQLQHNGGFLQSLCK